VLILGIGTAYGQTGSSKDIPDAGESSEPALQPDEDVANFNKGKGGNPKNGNSVFHKDIKMKTPLVGGTGCPNGTVGAALTPDAKTLSIAFDEYIAEAGNSYGVKRDIKTCAVVVPIETPPGMQFMIVKIDYRGYNSIPKNARTRFVTIYSLLDNDNKQIGKRLRRKYDFHGPLEEGYIISSDVSAKPVWSKCGKNVSFRIDTRAVAASNKKGDDTIATIDTVDASIGGGTVDYHLLWQTCADEQPAPDKPKTKKPKGNNK